MDVPLGVVDLHRGGDSRRRGEVAGGENRTRSSVNKSVVGACRERNIYHLSTSKLHFKVGASGNITIFVDGYGTAVNVANRPSGHAERVLPLVETAGGDEGDGHLRLITARVSHRKRARFVGQAAVDRGVQVGGDGQVPGGGRRDSGADR